MKTMKINGIIQTVLLTISVILLGYLVAGQVSESIAAKERIVQEELHAEAVDFCMQWEVGAATVIDGEIYCIVEIQLQFPNMWLTVPRYYDREHMEELTGLPSKLP